MSQTRTTVTIAGRQYTLCGDETAEQIQRVATALNNKIEELRAAHPDLPNADLAMLSAINITDDYIKMYDELEALKKEAAKLRKSQGASKSSPRSSSRSSAAKSETSRK